MNYTALPSKIAVVDDEASFRLFCELHLKRLGCQVESFHTFDKLLDSVKEKPDYYEALIIDRYVGAHDAISENIVKSCRYYRYLGKLFLFSVGNLTEATSFGFDGFLDKGSPIDWEGFLLELKRTRYEL